MEQAKTDLPQSLGAIPANSRFKEIDSVELTEEEKAEAIYRFKEKRYYELAQKAYWDKVNAVQNKGTRILTSDQVADFITQKAIREYGKFDLDKYNKEIFELLCLYFSGNPEFEKKGEGYSLKKGLWLHGNVGCGKTVFMKLFRDNHVGSYSVYNCRKVASDYSKEGISGINKYYGEIPNATNMFGHNKLGACFDDLGTEEMKKHYGDDLNVMADIILARYDHPLLKGRTHITTNIISDEVDTLYGNRVRSRLREMVNMVAFPSDAPDRRG